MPALVAGIHVFWQTNEGVDGRDKPGHDGGLLEVPWTSADIAGRA